MVYKKYIKRGGKIYGPYLYENKRVNGKVVTNYLGQGSQGKERKVRKNDIFYSVFSAVLVLAVVFLFVYDGSSSVLAGRVVDEFSSSSREKLSLELGEAAFLQVDDSISMESPGVLIDVLGDGTPISGSSADVVRIARPLLSGEAVSGELAEWRFPLRVIQPGVGEIRIRIVSAKQAGFLGPSTPRIIKRESAADVKFFNPSVGDYRVIFFLQTPYVESEEETSGGKEITVSNPRDASYGDLSVVSSINVGSTDTSGIRVIDGSGGEIEHRVFDVDGDGIPDVVKFFTSSGIESREKYKVLSTRFDRSRYGEPRFSVHDYDDLSDECKVDLECNTEIVCNYEISPNIFAIETPLEGRQFSTCISNNPGCPPVVRKKDACSVAKKVSSVDVEESEIYFSPAEKEFEVGEEVKTISVFDKETDVKVADVSVTEKKVDIVFSQQPAQPLEVQLSPDFSFCFNGIHDIDEGESGIDCGGFCRECKEEEENFFTLIAWIVVGSLLTLLFVAEGVDYLRFRGHLSAGKKALREKDVRGILHSYESLNKPEHMDSSGRLILDQKYLDFIEEVEETFEKNKANKILHFGFFRKVGDSHSDKIKRLIRDGRKAIFDNNINVALLNYEVVREVYDSLGREQKGRVKGYCDKYYKDLVRSLEEKKMKFSVGKGFLPIVLLLGKR